MTTQEDQFAQLLTEAIRKIKRLESTPIGVIQDQLGHAIGKKNGSTIEHWRKGNLPTKHTDFAKVTRQIIQRTDYGPVWFEQFCEVVEFPYTDSLRNELFPPPSTLSNLNTETVKPHKHSINLPNKRLPKATPLPAGSIMPLARNRFFVGRSQDLLRLATIFNMNDLAAVGQSTIANASGLGGVGKTQLSCEFVHLYGQYFTGGVFWLSFEKAEAIPSQIAECGGPAGLNLSDHFHDLTLDDQVRLVKAAWQKNVPRLLIFDNCEDETLLNEWRPISGGCRILITSRRGHWNPIFGVEQLSLGSLYRPESINLLKNLSQLDANDNILNTIADELGDLPLALHLAGRYLQLHQRVISAQSYLEQLKATNLLNHPSLQLDGLSPTGHIEHVAKTFALSFENLNSQNPEDVLAKDILVRAAHFAPGEPIWFELLIKMVQFNQELPPTSLQVDTAILRLIALGLIESQQATTFRIHRLIAAFVREKEQEQVEATIRIVEQVVYEEAARINEAGYPVPLLSKNLHLRSVTDIAQARKDRQGAQLCHAMGVHLYQVGEFAQAIPYFAQAQEIWSNETYFSIQHLAESHYRLGQTYRELDQLEDAMNHLNRAEELRKKHLGEQTLESAYIYNELARCFLQKGENKQAHDLFEKSYLIARQKVGLHHEKTADFLNNLGITKSFMGFNGEAVKMVEEALQIRLNVLDEHHPMTALSLNNMGFLYRDLGQNDKALGFYKRALTIRETIFGENHPATAESLNNLGELYFAQKELQQAEIHLRRSLSAYQTIFDKNHQDIAYPLNTLGMVMLAQGKFQQARQYLLEAYQIRERAYGAAHPLTIKVKENLAKTQAGPR